tara:strand:- start:1552 stop:1677 length:126 start_codon:yes stop_codon:yes gene_type:complete
MHNDDLETNDCPLSSWCTAIGIILKEKQLTSTPPDSYPPTE